MKRIVGKAFAALSLIVALAMPGAARGFRVPGPTPHDIAGSFSLTSNSATSYILTFSWTESDTADRTLTWLVNGASRSISLTGNPTLADWFNQSVKTTAVPAFAGLSIAAAATTDAVNSAVSITQTQASGGGSSSVPIGAIIRSNATGGTMNHAVALVGWQLPTSASIAGTYYGSEGRVDSQRNGVTGVGVWGYAPR